MQKHIPFLINEPIIGRNGMRKYSNKFYFIAVLLLTLTILSYFYIDYKKASIPDTFTVVTGESSAVFEDNNIDINSLKKGENSVDIKLMGVVPLKSVSIDVVDSQMVIPCGIPVGIYIETEGILVVDVVEITDVNGNNVCPALAKIQKGDYILEVDGEKVTSKSQLISAINKSKGADIVLKINRNGTESEIKVRPVCTGNDEYKLGIWVRDDTQGVGMLTYVTMDGQFAALGHGIHDPDTGKLMELSDGALFDAHIFNIVKGEENSPGELIGSIYYGMSTKLGEINSNTEKGIYGTYEADNIELFTPMQIAYKQDIEVGPAEIYTAVDGEVKSYDIEIIGVNMNSKEDEKGFMLKVVDRELLELTGGVVQGMSGSPIIQDGKIVGAVTHVLVNDPTKGYGIFIENMLEECD